MKLPKAFYRKIENELKIDFSTANDMFNKKHYVLMSHKRFFQFEA